MTSKGSSNGSILNLPSLLVRAFLYLLSVIVRQFSDIVTADQANNYAGVIWPAPRSAGRSALIGSVEPMEASAPDLTSSPIGDNSLHDKEMTCRGSALLSCRSISASF